MGLLDVQTEFERRLTGGAGVRTVPPGSTSGGRSPSGGLAAGGAGAAVVGGEGEADRRSSADASLPAAPSTVDASPPPCPACGCPWLWWDCYGNGPHCVLCRPIPEPSRLFLDRWARVDEGGLDGLDGQPAVDGGRPRARGERVDACRHVQTRRVRLLAAGGPAAGPEVGQGDRFEVCESCGWWRREGGEWWLGG